MRRGCLGKWSLWLALYGIVASFRPSLPGRQVKPSFVSLRAETVDDASIAMDYDSLDFAEDVPTESTPVITGLTLADLSAALASNVSYFYLQNELGLSEVAMWRVTYEAGSALGMTADTIRHKVDVLNATMNLSSEDIRQLIERHPTILHLSADKNIAPKILYLVRTLDLGKDELRELVLACPAVLSYSKATLSAKIRFFTRFLAYSTAEARNLILAEPNLLRASVRTSLVPKCRFLLRDLEMTPSVLKTIIAKHPRILLYSLENNLIPKLVYFLVMSLQLTPQQVGSLLQRYPGFVGYNLERHVRPISNYFLVELGWTTSDLARMLQRNPRLISFALSKIKHVVGFLRYKLGLAPNEVQRVLLAAPQLFGLAVDTSVQHRLDYLQAELQLTDDQLRQLITGMPRLLTLSIGRNLAPKLEYLRSVLGDDLQPTILKLPTLLGYSLDQRIRPRMQLILAAGIEPTSLTVGLPLSNAKFVAWVQAKVGKRRAAQPVMRLPPALGPPPRITHWTRERTSRE